MAMAHKLDKRYQRAKRKVELQLQDLQEQRLQQLAPSRLYLPVPWQPVVFEQPSTMYKVIAAQGGQFTSVFDSRVAYQLQEWTHARSGCGSKSGWPPLWSCMYAYPSEAEARHAVFPRGSQQQKGARVLCQVSVLGKGYQHPDGRVAVSSLRMDYVLEYVPKGPTERVVDVDYSTAVAEGDSSTCSSLSDVLREAGSSRRQRSGSKGSSWRYKAGQGLAPSGVHKLQAAA